MNLAVLFSKLMQTGGDLRRGLTASRSRNAFDPCFAGFWDPFSVSEHVFFPFDYSGKDEGDTCVMQRRTTNFGSDKLSFGFMVVSPSSPKRPHLNALRAFEAAARCGPVRAPLASSHFSCGNTYRYRQNAPILEHLKPSFRLTEPKA